MDVEVFVLELPLVAGLERIQLLSHVFFEAHLDISHLRKLLVIF
jgi:hypothetical protein